MNGSQDRNKTFCDAFQDRCFSTSIVTDECNKLLIFETYLLLLYISEIRQFKKINFHCITFFIQYILIIAYISLRYNEQMGHAYIFELTL